MKTQFQIVSKLSIITSLILLTSSSAFAAGGTITFTLSSATSVPSLSANMLIVLSVLLFIITWKTAKQKNTNMNKFFTFILGTGFIVSAGSGVKLVSDAYAGGTEIIFAEGSNTVEHRIVLDGNITSTFINNNPSAVGFSLFADDDDGSHPSCSREIDAMLTDDSPIQNQGTTTTGILPSGSFINVSCESD